MGDLAISDSKGDNDVRMQTVFLINVSSFRISCLFLSEKHLCIK